MIEPAFVSVPDGFDPNRTLGPEVGAVATLAGFTPDPEQQFCLDVAFALDKRGEPLVFDSTVVAPRQNLKTGFLKQRALGKLFVTQRRLVIWSAHEFDTVVEAARELEQLIDASDDLRREVKPTGSGELAKLGAKPEIELRSGARVKFKTRTSGGGRGLSGDDLFVDEAYAAQAGQMGAVMPTMLARPGAQVDFASSACRPESAYLWDRVQDGRAGMGPRSFYIEWCAPPPEEACDAGVECTHARGSGGCGCDKPEVIVLAHTAIARGRITMQKVLDLRRTMPEDEYPREVMGWHDRPASSASPISRTGWEAAADLGSAPVGSVALGLDMSGTMAAIAAVGGRVDGRRHGELTGRDGAVDARPGSGWVVDRLAAIASGNAVSVLVLDPSGFAGSLVPDLLARCFVKVTSVDAAVPAGKCGLYLVTAREYAQACGAIRNDIDNDLFRHLGQRTLTRAAESVRTRPLVDSYAWSAKDSMANIAPFVALTLARLGHAMFTRPDSPAPLAVPGSPRASRDLVDVARIGF